MGLPGQPNAVVELDGFGRGGDAHFVGEVAAEGLVVEQGGVALACPRQQAEQEAHGRFVEGVELQGEAAVVDAHLVLPPVQPFFGQGHVGAVGLVAQPFPPQGGPLFKAVAFAHKNPF
jgi:hypothetical protein